MTLTPAGHALAATMGKPAGIGGEPALMAWKNRHRAGSVFVAIDNADPTSFPAALGTAAELAANRHAGS